MKARTAPEAATAETPSDVDGLDHVRRDRLKKLSRIRELGIDPYPYSYHKTHTVGDVLERFDQLKDAQKKVRLAGRLMSLRLMGKAAFAHLQDEDKRLQIYVRRDVIGEPGWSLFLLLDIGDIVGVAGLLFKTRTEERTLEVAELQLLTKNLRPLPAVKEKDDKTWYGWDAQEERYRNRTIDLILNSNSRKMLLRRSRLVSFIRNFLDERGYVEVETPILQPIYGGANARPFTTYHHTYDRELYLRIADELYLKRLIAGGIPRVYEIGKDFRNEGIDRFHSPEFTMLECYHAYENYDYYMDLLEELLSLLAKDPSISATKRWEERQIDMSPPYERITMAQLIREHSRIDITNRDRNELALEIKKKLKRVEPHWGIGKLIDELFTKEVEPKLIQPTFVKDYPVETSPLAKRHPDNPALVERFELFVGGGEIANAFSELNDPIDQLRRFEDLLKLREQGDEEAPPIDRDFIEALEIGMPPTAGLGIGIDRLAMLLTGGSSIREVTMFPVLKPKE